ncbi:putative bifunctional diguanylate cyclase/phosphodiesterase [Geodermatophilus ruber]|uniref:PAS domain S-box-containing protein/diguanylate cyclase (GGDEF) domain-containing protein n=1 Tax=Geodermatophilus ruber TaxID=504800 RepID=A0A1I4ACW6_9ACTN|nr:EAL domain-containing protein [Geodermatophilus ruber]SFK54010.1 PAS domain S-box-containing protein/diguanylate cyclase (GGDEF) domain-containing protein [Geodermatophilus ruber]
MTPAPLRSTVYESLFVHGVDGVLITSADGQTLAANARACELLGWSEAELLELGRDGVVDQGDRRWTEALETRARDGAFRGTFRLRRRDGTSFPAEVTTATFLDGGVRRAFVSFRDITEAEAEAARTAETRRAAAEVIDSLEATSDMYIGVDASWRVTYINAQAEFRLGVVRDHVIGGDLWTVFPTLLGTPFEEAYRRVVRTGAPTTFEEHYAAADLWCEVRVYPLRRGGIGIYFRDIAERRAMEQERERLLLAERQARTVAERAQLDLAHRASHDELTGLLNRAGLVQHVASVQAKWPATGLTVLFIDLDRFKLVNDSLGHGTGDHLLAAFARRLAALAGPTDMVARFGGDEFVVVMFDVPTAAAARMAEAVIATSREPVDIGARLLVTASVGLSSAAGPADLDTLLREADAALYRAKDAGREQFAWFDEQMHRDSVHRVQTEQDLRQALDRDELLVEYQPAFDLRFERISHVEALVRWQHPLRGLVPPLDFIPVAEESGLIQRVGEWVLARAVAQATRWSHIPDLRVWVNVSPHQLADAGLPERLAAQLHRAGLPGDRLGIEVTESALADVSRLAEVLGRIRALGVAIAIDDFGTGYSSLARLNALPVDVIKIDQMFVADLGTARGEAVVAGIVTLAHAIGAEVIAEGVETLPQLTTLSALGVDSACGYLLARPSAPEHLPMTVPAESSFCWRAGMHPSVARVPPGLRPH